MNRNERRATSWAWVGRTCVLAAVLCAGAIGCQGGGKKPPRAREVMAPARDVPEVLRNTVGSQTSLIGMDPVVVSGYGLVVGLNGTGSRSVPLPIRTYMEREMTRLGVGREIGSLRDVSPSELLDDPNTAVVVVEAIIPPAAPQGAKFDVRVRAAPGTATTSLEGGTLYTTELRLGAPDPTGPVTAVLAHARGPIFINPFIDPASESGDGVVRTIGRVLNGGTFTGALNPALVLDTPSHSRARAIVDAVNTRFPQGTSRLPTARGISEDTIEIRTPDAYRENTAEFVQLLRYCPVDQTAVREWARRYVEALPENPELAGELSWALQAVGELAVPYLRKLYDYVEPIPRLAALRAGARLGDMTTRPHLEEVAMNGTPAQRVDAIRLLQDLGPDPKTERILADLLNSPQMDVRVAAYEALAARRSSLVTVRRFGEKFELATVPSSESMIFVTQQKAPRIVLFGEKPSVNRPVFVEAWDGRFMVSSQTPTDQVRVFYRDYRSGRITTAELEPDLVKLIEYMAHEPTPENPAPGLGFSYSEIVGALAQIVDDGGVDASFLPEVDVLALELQRGAQVPVVERPELSESGPLDSLAGVSEAATESDRAGAEGESDTKLSDEERERRRKRFVVPLTNPEAPPSKPPPNDG